MDDEKNFMKPTMAPKFTEYTSNTFTKGYCDKIISVFTPDNYIDSLKNLVLFKKFNVFAIHNDFLINLVTLFVTSFLSLVFDRFLNFFIKSISSSKVGKIKIFHIIGLFILAFIQLAAINLAFSFILSSICQFIGKLDQYQSFYTLSTSVLNYSLIFLPICAAAQFLGINPPISVLIQILTLLIPAFYYILVIAFSYDEGGYGFSFFKKSGIFIFVFFTLLLRNYFLEFILHFASC